MAREQDWSDIRRLLGYSRRHARRIIIAAVASIGVAASDVATAKLVQPFVDHLLVDPNPAFINLVPLVVVTLALVKGLCRYTQGYFIKTAGQLVVQDLRNDLFSHCLGLSMRFYAKMPSSTVISRVLNDVNILQRTATDDLVELVRESLTLIGLTVLVFYTDYKLALIAFLVLPVSVIPASMIGRKIKNYSKRGLQAISQVTGVLQETMAAVKVIKAFGTEDYERNRFCEENGRFYNFIRKVLKYDAAAKPVVELIASLGAAGVLWYGITRVVAGEITQGEFSTFVAAMLMMYSPVNRLTKVNANLQRSFSASERIFELIDTPYEVRDQPEPLEIQRARGEVVFDQVDFAYETVPVLRQFSVVARPGEVVALVGPSGAGKSTVVGLLARFYDPQSGSIRIDGKDIRDLSLDSLRANLAFVDQDTVLFNTTISENIRYGRRDATDEEVRKAASQAFADEFINELEEGYEANIGDRGIRLSGGQRQRLCIARAILRDAPILILDEATSALDTESELIVQKALANLMQHRTTFVIAHRLSTIMSADQILVMENGAIQEVGTHDELLAREGLYRKLYQMQFRGEA